MAGLRYASTRRGGKSGSKSRKLRQTMFLRKSGTNNPGGSGIPGISDGRLPRRQRKKAHSPCRSPLVNIDSEEHIAQRFESLLDAGASTEPEPYLCGPSNQRSRYRNAAIKNAPQPQDGSRIAGVWLRRSNVRRAHGQGVSDKVIYNRHRRVVNASLVTARTINSKRIGNAELMVVAEEGEWNGVIAQ